MKYCYELDRKWFELWYENYQKTDEFELWYENYQKTDESDRKCITKGNCLCRLPRGDEGRERARGHEWRAKALEDKRMSNTKVWNIVKYAVDGTNRLFDTEREAMKFAKRNNKRLELMAKLRVKYENLNDTEIESAADLIEFNRRTILDFFEIKEDSCSCGYVGTFEFDDANNRKYCPRCNAIHKGDSE